MVTIDLIGLLLRGPTGGPPVGVAVACLMLAAATLGPHGASGGV